MEGLSNTNKMKKKPTLNDYAAAVKNYREKTDAEDQNQPSESAISRLLKTKKKKTDKRRKPEPERRGRPPKATKKQIKKLFTIHKKLEKRNKGRDVTARMLKEAWDVDCDTRTISRYFSQAGKPWRRVLRKIQLTKEKKEARVAFAGVYAMDRRNSDRNH